jgi:hypothetical protein
MKSIAFRINRILIVILLVLVVATSRAGGMSVQATVGAGTISPSLADPAHYVQLSVTPAIVTPGELVTLHITYHNVGLPLTYISIIPPENLAYEPEIAIPCYGCSDVTLRALTTGLVRIYATASGEIFDEGCHCWVFTMVPDNGPAVLHVVDQLWTVFLPAVGR